MSDASSSYESDSSSGSSSEEEQVQIAKPVFISKKQRSEQSQQSQPAEEERKRQVLMSKLSTDQTITPESELNKKQDDFDGIDDTDDLNPEEEYNAWKQREILRFNRDQNLIISKELEKEEALTRRNN
ncbi:hypothetical protein JA1_001591 [Spathaspora sp. JA1]|nr:hypothetical protein JA1_001591 [Spathaspora sp. JA1]